MAVAGKGGTPRQTAVDKYTQALEKASKRLGDDLDKLITEYIKIVDSGGHAYMRAAELANRVYHQIEGPARAVYEKQERTAQHAYNAIMGPANAELKRITDAAQDMYNQAIAPVESAYQVSINDAGSIMQGAQLGDIGSLDTTTPWTT